jgi:hypothetical protein
MKVSVRTARFGIALIVLIGARAAAAEVTGSFDGQITGRKVVPTVAAAAALSQAGSAVTGTLALGGDAFAGAYLVQGKATTKRLKLSGSAGATNIVWKAKIVGDTLQGKAKLKGSGGRVVGTLVLQRNVSAGDGSGCDAVLAQNQTFFADKVLGQAMVSCTVCHVPGGQASATRLHVTSSDPTATARAIAVLVDTANPTASRIIEKPLAVVPHGGGQQITPGSPEALILQQWVDLVAQAHCN